MSLMTTRCFNNSPVNRPMDSTQSNSTHPPEAAFLGLAPFLRMSISGADLQPLGQEMLVGAVRNEDDANQWMNLSTVMFCLGQRDLGLSIQAQALAMQRTYLLAASQQPAKLRLLMLVSPGDLSANTPLDCLLENSDIDLVFHYVSAGEPVTVERLPEHDALMVALGESDQNRALLSALKAALVDWPKPVINAPQYIPAAGRSMASRLLRDAPGLFIPPTQRVPRQILSAIALGNVKLLDVFSEYDFPIILRPVDSHGGHGLDRIEGCEDVGAYLSKVNGAEYFLSRFIDYSGEDGLFRKIRIAVIDGKPFACHMAVSAHWMIHYVNAGMYEDASKRAQEAAFMADFANFAERHAAALDAIAQRTKLDYFCIDCAEMPDGRLLIFEIDHAMVVHAMDTEEMFPFKQEHMMKVRNAFREYLFRRTAAQS